MDDISQLIKEAKPLYFEKKRQKFQTIMVLGMFLFMIPMLELNNYIQKDILFSDSDSIIASQGLPTDDYGLLTVE